MLVYVLFYLGQSSHFPSCFGAGVTNLNEPPSSFLLPPHYCGLGAGSIPFRAIANNKQCEMRGLFMSLVIHYWIGDVQDCQSVSASEMTYIVSSGALNSTHSLAQRNLFCVHHYINKNFLVTQVSHSCHNNRKKLRSIVHFTTAILHCIEWLISHISGNRLSFYHVLRFCGS